MLFSSIVRNASRAGMRRFPTASKNTTKTTQLQSTRAMASGSGGIPSPILHQWYNIFGKSTIGYATWLIAGIIVAEGLTGVIGDGIWNSVNSGRTFETVDWSKFATDDDDDDEDEDEDEDDEEEEGDDDEDEE